MMTKSSGIMGLALAMMASGQLHFGHFNETKPKVKTSGKPTANRAKVKAQENSAQPPRKDRDMSNFQLSEAEFTKRFTVHCKAHCGFTHFECGTAVEDYCANVATSYYEDKNYRSEGPESCAEADMSYWGEN